MAPPKAETAAINAINNLHTALAQSGAAHDPAGMTDTDINRVVDAAYTARAALDAAGGPLKTAADKLTA
ncbi:MULTISPECIES: hypothetical protein [unclassified Streptomyces]|uniref:hypothetical protein n=1 Tax=unclassified Streptomyces TaxID=2593676 RepID=UPI00088901A6|nr:MULTISPECIES: hypothetical protein [unclassified Streptomyces]PBC72270.1 hypothetical protein BX261_7354 [Streptomyces sp. 2321.6]SDR61897.1 hypothetical protein SAMN05216511_7215 [Streptomyces sp. KS_16]SEE48738.1 hypothetical protein SAMN05428940_7264 [Streptomyces sp. 2133.1]SNC77775.1 hypothetical protein SAMN06272741_7191 [Streptomyces sp. 2114.4]